MFSTAARSSRFSVKLTTSTLVFATMLTNSAHDAYARQSEVDKAAARVAERIAKTGRSKVVVTDFTGPKDQINELGVQLADEFSSALASAEPRLQMVPRTGSSLKSNVQLRYSRMIDERARAQLFSKTSGAEIVIVGDMNQHSDRVDLSLRVYEIPPKPEKDSEVVDASILTEIDVQRPISPPEAKLLKQSLASAGNGFFLTAGLGRSQHNTTSPQCVDCPPPRSIKASTVLLMVTVTTEGRAVDVELLKTSDTRAVKAAMEAVKNWRFLPARGLNGQPIAVRTEIEVHTTDR
jgi:TonB family protein